MQSLFERRVFFYEFSLLSKPELVEWSFPKIIKRIEPAQKLGKLSSLTSNESACIRIQDMDFDQDKDILTLMINYTDKNLSNPGLQKIHSKDLRKIQKSTDEGIANSLHIVIATTPNKHGSYTGAVEYVPGFSKGLYLRLINNSFKKYCTDVVFDEKKKKKRQCYPFLDSAVLEGEKLKETLKTRKLNGVELLRYDKKVIDVDEPDEVEVTKQILFLKPKSETFADKAYQFINTCKNIGKKKKYNEIRLRFKNEDGDPASLIRPTSDLNAGELYFGKKKRVALRKPIDLCSESIHPELKKRMTLMVIAESNSK